MFAKLGWILLVVTGFAAAFIGGAVAPENLRGEVVATAERLIDLPLGEASAPTDGLVVEEGALPYKALLLSATPPEGTLYGVRLGLYPHREDAADAIAILEAEKLPFRWIPLDDGWLLLAAGEFASEGEVLGGGARRLARLGLVAEPDEVVVIVLPPEEKKKK